jgi:hypothetical protein
LSRAENRFRLGGVKRVEVEKLRVIDILKEAISRTKIQSESVIDQLLGT